MFLKLRLKVRNFIKKHKNKIIIILVFWAVILAINFFIGLNREEIKLNTTYEPHEVLLKSDFEVPEKLQVPIEDIIDNYVNKCNEKDYSGAYALLTDDCKKNVFGDSEEKFKEYAEGIFPHKKRYSIQDYSNYGEYYIYSIKLIDDIITTGLTDQEFAYYEEKIAIKQNGDQLQLCVNNYMGYQELKNVAEDDYLKIRVENKKQYYNYEVYELRITNKTDKTAVLYDSVAGNEIYGTIGDENRNPSMVSSTILLDPNETRTFYITFDKFYDNDVAITGIIFDKIRIMNEYTGREETEEEEINKSEKIYSITMHF